MPISTDTETIHDQGSSSPPESHAVRIAAAAHDLRSPLNAILGWAKLLAMKHGADPDIAAIAERIERSGRSQLKIIEELDALSRDGGA
jgi:signal transduction histidine kinase